MPCTEVLKDNSGQGWARSGDTAFQSEHKGREKTFCFGACPHPHGLELCLRRCKKKTKTLHPLFSSPSTPCYCPSSQKFPAALLLPSSMDRFFLYPAHSPEDRLWPFLFLLPHPSLKAKLNDVWRARGGTHKRM